MNKRILSLVLLSLLIAANYVGVAIAHPPNGTDPSYLVMDTVLEPESLDPAWAYDIGSHEVIMNVYEPLLFFDRDSTLGPYAAGKVDQFVPKLATSWIEQNINEVSPEGLMWVKRWTFTIRTGVRFHDGSTLIPEDVEYSFERLLVQDRDGGPAWMLYEPLLGVYRAVSPSEDSYWGLKIDHAIECNQTAVWFNLVRAFPSVTFKQILSQTWGCVIERAWSVRTGDLNVIAVSGGWGNWQDIYVNWHNPAVSFLDSPSPDMMGTGPYKFNWWTCGDSWSITMFNDYWDGWPAWKSEARTERLGGYITTVVWYYIGSWFTRRVRFQTGTSDLCYVDRVYRDQILGTDRIRCYYHWDEPPDEPPEDKPAPPKKLSQSSSVSSTSSITYRFPLLALDAFFFNFDIAGTSQYMGVHQQPGTFSENGIPPDIFSDINVRRGFAHAFEYTDWLNTMYRNEGERPSSPVIKGLPYHNPNQPRYTYDYYAAQYYLKLAWGGVDIRSGIPGVPVFPEDPNQVIPGDLWNNGMKFTIVYPAGNAALEQGAMMLAGEINRYQPEIFHVDVRQEQWNFFFLPAMVAGQLPLYFMGWHGSNLDPHYYVHLYMHSEGTFARFQRYYSSQADSLIEAGINTPDGPGREQIYYELQALYHDDIPSVPIGQPAGRQFERDWMRGWYYNPFYQGQYVYHRWKAITHFGDISSSTAYGMQDGAVNGADSSFLSAHYSSPPGTYGYHLTADINGGMGGTSGSQIGPVRGISDGKVDIVDLGLVNAYWDNPKGASHP